MKSEFHLKYSFLFINKLVKLLIFIFSIELITFALLSDFLGSFYLFLGLAFVISFKLYFTQIIRDFNKISLFFLIVFVGYFSFPILAYFKYTYSTVIWILLIPIGALLFYPKGSVFKLFIYLIIYEFCLILLQSKIDFLSGKEKSYSQVFYGDIVSVISIFLILIFFIIEYNNIKKKYSEFLLNQKIKIIERQEERIRLEIGNQLNFVKNYIVSNNLYRKSDFTIQDLSKNIGKSYFEISKILKNNDISNFKLFINTIRINSVVDRIRKGDLERLTIQALYQENGFEHQSTFNRVFKEITGQTPSEFVKNLDKNQN